MKRCPQCNRVENDDALAFCRTDGAPLVIESGSISAEAGTIKLGSGLVSTDVATSILPIQTDAEIARSTGPTTVLPTTTTPSSTRELTTAKRRGIVFGLIALAVLLVALAAYFYFSRRSTPAIQSIAVMPFLNESGNMDVEYLSDGMTETLISSLSQIPNLNVKARSTVFRYKGKVTDVKTIGKELGVQAVLNGHVVQRGNRLTLSLELTDTQTENVIWSDKYDRDQADLINLQNEIARDVSSRLKLKLTGADQQKLVRNYTLDPEVYKLYLQGRFYWNKSSISEVAKAETYFKQAVDRDPNFALGLVGLADCFQDVDRPRKKEYIRRALDIDDNLAEAHASLGYQLMCDREWLASERELKRAMTLNPNYAQSYAWNGGRLMMIGKYDEALASIQRGLDLEPTSNNINFYKGVCLAVSGRRDEAVQQFKRLQAMDPTFVWTHSFLGRLYVWMGNYAAAVEERAKSSELAGRPEQAQMLRESFTKGGYQGFLNESVKRMPETAGARGPLTRSATYLAEQGEKEKAIELLNQAAERSEFWLFLIKVDPGFDSLRGDPRFEALVKKFDPPKQN